MKNPLPPSMADSHARSVAGRFSASAATYERHATVQSAAAERVAALAAALPTPACILEIGCGTGLLTVRLVRLFPDARVWAVDPSPAMIEKTRASVAGAGHVVCVNRRFETLNGAGPFDLAVSNSALHWVIPLDRAFSTASRLVAPGGHLVCSVMLRDTLRELHEARRVAAPAKPVRARLPDEGEVLSSLRRNDFDPAFSAVETVRTEAPSAAALLRGLHEQGLTGGDFSHGEDFLNRSEIRGLTAYYDEKFRTPSGGVFATYEFLCVAAGRKNTLR